MFKWIKPVWPDLRLVKWWSWITLIFSVISFVCVVLVGLLTDPQVSTPWVLRMQNAVASHWISKPVVWLDPWANNDVLSGVIIGGLTWLGSISIIKIFKLPGIRNSAIRGIAFGYCENFLRKLVTFASEKHATYRIVIVMPRFELVTHAEVYWHSLKQEIKELGFEMQTKETDQGFGRNAFFIEKREAGRALPMYIDIPTTTRVLQELLELEADMPIGRGKDRDWFKARFRQMREEFAQAVRDYYPEDALPNLVFVTPTSDKEFRAKMKQAIQDLEHEIDQEAARKGKGDHNAQDVDTGQPPSQAD